MQQAFTNFSNGLTELAFMCEDVIRKLDELRSLHVSPPVTIVPNRIRASFFPAPSTRCLQSIWSSSTSSGAQDDPWPPVGCRQCRANDHAWGLVGCKRQLADGGVAWRHGAQSSFGGAASATADGDQPGEQAPGPSTSCLVLAAAPSSPSLIISTGGCDDNSFLGKRRNLRVTRSRSDPGPLQYSREEL